MGRTFVLPFLSLFRGWLLGGSSASWRKSAQGLGRLAKLESLHRAASWVEKSEPCGLDDSHSTARYVGLCHRWYSNDVRWVRVARKWLGLLWHLCRLRAVVGLHLNKLTAVLAFFLQLGVELLDNALVAGCFSQLEEGRFFSVDDLGCHNIGKRVQDTRHARRATATSRHSRDEKNHGAVNDSTGFGSLVARGGPPLFRSSFAALGSCQPNHWNRSCRFGATCLLGLGRLRLGLLV